MAITRLALRLIEYPAPDYLVARACHISPGKFSCMQQGKYDITMNIAIRLAAIFGCSPNDVIGWADDHDYTILDGGRLDECLVS